MGGFIAPALLCEDSVLFKQNLLYSLATKTEAIIWQCPADWVMTEWPVDLKRIIMVRCLEKYRWLFHRLERLDT